MSSTYLNQRSTETPPTQLHFEFPFDSHHSPHIKAGIVWTLLNRVYSISNREMAKRRETSHIQKVFQNIAYPTGFIRSTMNPKTQAPQPEWITTVTSPYVKGTSESVRQILMRVNIRVTFKCKTTLKSMLMRVKPRLRPENRKGVIYCIPSKDCDQVYVGETGRTLSL